MDPKQRRKLVERYKVVDGRNFRLKQHATDDKAGLNNSKGEMADLLREEIGRASCRERV